MNNIKSIPLPFISGKTRLMGILGEGIGHTLSPLMHNASIQKLGLDYLYVPFDLKAARIKPLLESLWDAGAVGFNVTVPHKETVAEIVGADNLRSVNTIFRGSNGWQGDSTDAMGFFRGVERLGTSIKKFRRIFILGNGGVTLGLLKELSREFDRGLEVVIFRRQASKDQKLLAVVSSEFNIRFVDFNPANFRREVKGHAGESLIIQATSAPLRGDRLDEYADGLQNFHGYVTDLVYGAPSALFDRAKELRLPCQDGLPMLIEQARESQLHWWGTQVEYEFLESVLQSVV